MNWNRQNGIPRKICVASDFVVEDGSPLVAVRFSGLVEFDGAIP